MNSEYSYSLFLVAKEANILDEIYENIKAFLNVIKDKEIENFFKSIEVKKEDKKTLLNKMFNIENIYFRNFLNILIDDNKFMDVEEILNEYVKLYYKEKNIVEGIVYSPQYEENKIKKLEETFSTKLNKKVILNYKEDKKLISGYKVIVDNKLYDNSYLNKLNMLRKELLKEGEYSD